MPEITAFQALRYDLGHVGSLSDVIAPPYDVIGPDFQDELYKKHPANVIRLILNREEQGDDDNANRYSRAAKFLKNWREEGVLQQETAPAMYVYHQIFSYGGQEYTRRGFMAACGLQPFGEGNIYPHEETHSAAKVDRLKLINACQANLSQIFGIYSDPDNEAQNLLENAVIGETPLEATDHLGVVHRMWAMTDPKVAAEVNALMGPKATYVADGHHRYETACNYQKQLKEAGELTPEHGANSVLMMCVSMDDPGMIVLPTHRLFKGIPPLTSEELIAKLGDKFETRIAGEGVDLADGIWDQIESADQQGTLGLYTAKDGRWVLATITDAGRARMDELASDRSEDWRGLGVAILAKLVVEDCLGQTGLPTPTYVHLVEELVEEVDGDEAGDYSLSCLVMPATLEHIRLISEHGERMPAKSTYFYPKLLSGMVIKPLE